jgi:phospholipid transport system transporter-binding protein
MQLPSRLTHDSAAAAFAELQSEARRSPGPLTIDGAALAAFDSAALALLLQARRMAQAAGRGFELRGAPPQLVQLAQLYGVDGLLGLSSAGPGRVPPSSG